jgi:hypothetical protein
MSPTKTVTSFGFLASWWCTHRTSISGGGGCGAATEGRGGWSQSTTSTRATKRRVEMEHAMVMGQYQNGALWWGWDRIWQRQRSRAWGRRRLRQVVDRDWWQRRRCNRDRRASDARRRDRDGQRLARRGWGAKGLGLGLGFRLGLGSNDVRLTKDILEVSGRAVVVPVLLVPAEATAKVERRRAIKGRR